MKYRILNEEYQFNFLERLLKIRGITDYQSFFEPKFNEVWLDPFQLNDMEKGVNRIIEALKKKEKICIFGDYDVDGVTSSFCLYEFFTKFLHRDTVSIKYPNRREDGYGLKNKHLDEMKAEGVQLIITVDNGIGSVEEAKYAKELGMDMVITDHHQVLDQIPEACAVINPNCSENYPFKGLAGVGVAFKLIIAMLMKSQFSKEDKNLIFQYFLPVVAIGSIADVVPLLEENRMIVKKGLELLNHQQIFLKSLSGFISFLNIKKDLTSTDVAFTLAPRINAGGRMETPYDSLNIFTHEGKEQLPYLEKLEQLNSERKKIQDEGVKYAEETLNFEKKILIVAREDFHEGVIGIIAGKLTEKYNKPSVVFKKDAEKGIATASLRGPDYFSVIEMISAHKELLERCGGHKGAGGLTVKLENFDLLCQKLEEYCETLLKDQDFEKEIVVDTKILPEERNPKNIAFLEKFAPYGEGNQEPLFLFENIKISNIEKFGKVGVGHMKIYGERGDNLIQVVFWKKGDECDKVICDTISVIGKIQEDTFNKGYYIVGEELIEKEEE